MRQLKKTHLLHTRTNLLAENNFKGDFFHANNIDGCELPLEESHDQLHADERTTDEYNSLAVLGSCETDIGMNSTTSSRNFKTLTSINFLSIRNTTEREDIVKVSAFNGQLARNSTRSKDELLVRECVNTIVNGYGLVFQIH